MSHHHSPQPMIAQWSDLHQTWLSCVSSVSAANKSCEFRLGLRRMLSDFLLSAANDSQDQIETNHKLPFATVDGRCVTRWSPITNVFFIIIMKRWLVRSERSLILTYVRRSIWECQSRGVCWQTRWQVFQRRTVEEAAANQWETRYATDQWGGYSRLTPLRSQWREGGGGPCWLDSCSTLLLSSGTVPPGSGLFPSTNWWYRKLHHWVMHFLQEHSTKQHIFTVWKNFLIHHFTAPIISLSGLSWLQKGSNS